VSSPDLASAGKDPAPVGSQLPQIVTPVPGPQSRRLAERLRRVESPNVTFMSDGWPVFWERALGTNVWDADGNRYVDFSAAFGVMAVGHANPRVTEAGAAQLARLAHGMGDVHPSALKVRLAERLADLAPGNLSQVIFSSSGSEAVESALKTVMMATGKPGVLAYRESYHGLGFGSLDATGRDFFRKPFVAQLAGNAIHVPYPDCRRCPVGQCRDACSIECLRLVEQALDDPPAGSKPVGGILIEPVLGRGGDVPAPTDYLVGLRQLCDRRGLLLVADEIYTGFGRTGRWFGIEHAGVVPDLMCLGKGMTGGFPISTCIGTPDVMSAWGPSAGEALHTSTFLGSPLGCAMALATLEEIEGRGLVERAERLGRELRNRLVDLASRFDRIAGVRGPGLMIGIELARRDADTVPTGVAVAHALLREGIIVLPSGADNQVLSLSPPLVVHERQIDCFLDRLAEALSQLDREG